MQGQHWGLKARALLLAALLGIAPQALAGPSPAEYLEFLDARIAADPMNPEHYLRRATMHADSGHPAAAQKDLARAEKVGGVTSETQLTRGILAYRAGQFREARRQFDRVLAKNPEATAALSYRARLLRDLRQNSAALADYQKLIALDPQVDLGHYLATATLLLKDNTQGPEAALQLLDARMAQIGVVPQLQGEAIRIEQQRGRTAAVVRRLRAMDAHTQSSPEWQMDLGEALLRDCQLLAAAESFKQAKATLAARRDTVANQTAQKRLALLMETSASTDCTDGRK